MPRMIRLCGVDEAGRGALAGPVVAASVILKPYVDLSFIDDSKRLSYKQRRQAFDYLRDHSHWSIGLAGVEEIERLNILQATMLAMKRALLRLKPTPSWVLVDGNRLPQLDERRYAMRALISGDGRSPCIQAASIIAKETRDRVMIALDQQYQGYGFAQHKGYGTAQHLQALARLGVRAIHRRGFEPVRKACC